MPGFPSVSERSGQELNLAATEKKPGQGAPQVLFQ
jgi:hypothetical protein